MLLSQITETEWLSSLAHLPPWHMPAGPILLIAPHPDDESLAAGGLIASASRHGIDVTIVAVTDGENAYDDSPSDALQLAIERRSEQENALARLGVPREKIIRLGLPDSGLSTRQPDLEQHLTPLISAQTHVIAPWPGDFHPDHEACGRAATTVARRVGAALSFYFFWTWHRGTPELLHGLNLRSLPLTPDLLQAKQEALHCHRSQLEREGGTPILPLAFLAPAARPFEVFALG